MGRAEAAQQQQRADKRRASPVAKVQDAQELKGGFMYTGTAADGSKTSRQLEAGERLTWQHALEMVDLFGEWVEAVGSAEASMQWPAAAIERQIVLINTMHKDKVLISELQKVDAF